MTKGNYQLTDNIQASLKEDYNTLYKYLDTSAAIFLVINKKQEVEFANRKACELLGFQRNKIIGKNWFDNFIPKRNRKELASMFNQIVQGKIKPPDGYENIILNKDGQERLIQWRNGNLLDDEGKMLSLISSGVDITEQKRAEQIAKKSEQKLHDYTVKLEEKVKERTSEVLATVEQLVTTNLNLEDQIQIAQAAEKSAITSKFLSSAIAKNFPNGFIIVFDANFKMILKKGETINELGLDRVISEGVSIDDIRIFSKAQKVKLKEDVLKTMKGEHLSYEITYRKKYFSVNTTPLVDENNVISRVLFVYNDISQQKKVEQDAQNALKKEQELNELKSRFISMASHEFRTPLSAIQTSAILIGKQNEPGKEEKREKYVKQIKKNVKHLVVILNDFLSLSKLEEGKVTTNREVFDLIDFSKTLIEEISITTREGQSIQFSASKNTHSLYLDQKLTRHILMNLLSNAIKYSPDNTTISFNIEENDRFVTIAVSDQGIGIPEEEQKNMFERFFRAKNVHNIEGTGLGLNIVKQYVTLMGGSIDFKSEPNKGTTFWVKFPKLNNELQ